jgi:hypothetical protein
MTDEQVETKLKERKVGDIILRVIGGEYGDRVDVDFAFVVCTVEHIGGKPLKSWTEFHFWLLSSPADHSQLVLRTWSNYRLVIEALGALIKAVADPEVNIFVQEPPFNRHIKELFFEYGHGTEERPPDTYDWIPDLALPDEVKTMVETPRVCGHAVMAPGNLTFKAFRVFKKSSDKHVQRVRIKHQKKLTFDWEQLKQAPIELTWFAWLKQKSWEALVFFFRKM